MNNLPATLLLLPAAAAGGGVAAVLAVLVGVNVGPQLTYVGSLATLLWRRVLTGVQGVPTMRDYTALGALTAPVVLVASTVAVWLSVRLIGAGG
jgi:arsenical pump membrane protein